MAVNVLIDGLTADGQVYRAGRVENPGPQLLRAAREKRKWGDRLMVEEIDTSPTPKPEDYSNYYDVDYIDDKPSAYKCKLCGYVTTEKRKIAGHLTMKHFRQP